MQELKVKERKSISSRVGLHAIQMSEKYCPKD